MAEKKTSNSGEKKRYRNFTTIVYPDSAPEGWQNILAENCIPCFISPLHDKDINPEPENGSDSLKKAHWHVVFVFDSLKSEEQVKGFISLVNGVGMQVVHNLRSCARYLCHLDNPDKAQYSVSDVVCIGGLDYFGLIQSDSDLLVTLSDIMDFCDTNQIYSFSVLVRYCRSSRPDWFRLISKNFTYVIDKYIKSLLWEHENGGHVILDNIGRKEPVDSCTTPLDGTEE